jgi:hypothetical protein
LRILLILAARFDTVFPVLGLALSGTVYVNTGYTNALADNVLLAFSTDAQ